MGKGTDSELNTFIKEWKETPEKNRGVFLNFREYLGKKKGVTGIKRGTTFNN